MTCRYLLRLGMGEQELATEMDFSRVGRVNAMLARRLELLAEVNHRIELSMQHFCNQHKAVYRLNQLDCMLVLPLHCALALEHRTPQRSTQSLV